MISSVVSRLVILVFGTLYPAYASYKAVRTKNVKEYVKWMMYWIVFALFTCAETFTDVFLSFWFPFYYEIKTILVLWLLSPATKGSSILYRKFVHPMLNKREQEIDEYIAKAKEQSYHTVLHLGSRGVNYATTVLMQTAIKGGGGLVNQIRRSYSLSDLSNDNDTLADVNRNNKALVKDELDQPDAPDPRLLRPRGYSPRRSASGSGRVEMYFPEVDVDVRQHGTRPREPSIPLSHIRSTEDVSSGYSSAEPLYGTHHPTQGIESLSASREPLVRTSSVGSTRSMRTKSSRGGVVGKRTPAEDSEAWDEADDEAEWDCQEDCFHDVPSSIPAPSPYPPPPSAAYSQTPSSSSESPSPSSFVTLASPLHDTTGDSSCPERNDQVASEIRGTMEVSTADAFISASETEETAAAVELFPSSSLKETEEVVTDEEFFAASGVKETDEVTKVDEFFSASGIEETEETTAVEEFFAASGGKETEEVAVVEEFVTASTVKETREISTADGFTPSSIIEETKMVTTVKEFSSASEIKGIEGITTVEEFYPASGIEETEESTKVDEFFSPSGTKETEESTKDDEFFSPSGTKETEESTKVDEFFSPSGTKETEEATQVDEFFFPSGTKETEETTKVDEFFFPSGTNETEEATKVDEFSPSGIKETQEVANTDEFSPASGIKETELVTTVDQFIPSSGIKVTEETTNLDELLPPTGIKETEEVATVHKFFPASGIVVTEEAVTSTVEPVSCDVTCSSDVLDSTSIFVSAIETVPALPIGAKEDSLRTLGTVDNAGSHCDTLSQAALEPVETPDTTKQPKVATPRLAPPSPGETGRHIPAIVESLTVLKEEHGHVVKARGSTETLTSSLSGSVVSLTQKNRGGRYHKWHAPSPPPEASPVQKSPSPARPKQKGGTLSLTSILPSRSSIGHLASFLPFWSGPAAPVRRSSDNLRIRDLSQSPKSGRKSSHH